MSLKLSIMVRFAGIEAGGTSWVVAIAEGDPSNIVERADFPTATPKEVLANVVEWLKPRKVRIWFRQFHSLAVLVCI